MKKSIRVFIYITYVVRTAIQRTGSVKMSILTNFAVSQDDPLREEA
jgi:hypothetical protein